MGLEILSSKCKQLKSIHLFDANYAGLGKLLMVNKFLEEIEFEDASTSFPLGEILGILGR